MRGGGLLLHKYAQGVPVEFEKFLSMIGVGKPNLLLWLHQSMLEKQRTLQSSN